MQHTLRYGVSAGDDRHNLPSEVREGNDKKRK